MSALLLTELSGIETCATSLTDSFILFSFYTPTPSAPGFFASPASRFAMSLRWKPFRFLSVETLLDTTAGREDASSFGEVSLFPTLSAERNHERASQQRVLRRFATAAERAVSYDSIDGTFVLALPRGVVQLFHLASLDPSLTLGSYRSLHETTPPLHYTFSAHDGAVFSLVLVRHGDGVLPSLVTLGVDDGNPCLKVWKFRVRETSRSPIPPSSAIEDGPSPYQNGNRPVPADENRLECIAVYRLQSDSRPKVLAVKDAKLGIADISEIAIGFEDASVTILYGEIYRERAMRVRVAPAPGEMIQAKPIVFLRYCGTLLYCVSKVSVVVIVSVVDPEKDASKPVAFRREILDNMGSSTGKLCTVLDYSAELVVARAEGLYFFNRDGLGPCIAFPTEGQKAMVSSMGNYLIHSTEPGSITAYDVVNKLVAYRGKGVLTGCFQGHSSYTRNAMLCSADGSILKLSEISLQQRVNMLLKRGLHVPAIALARAESGENANKSNVMLTSALRQYAEYLMGKNRYDEAAEHLVQTIGGGVEPSWVVTRLVEQSGLRSGLRLYLEALHAAGRAAFAHTKVLITCYRHDRARGAILGSNATEKTNDEYVINVFSDVDWTEEQVDAAIVLCRDAGLFKVAERVSRRRGRHVQLAHTLVEDLGETEKALALLRSLEDVEALQVIKACGRRLLEKEPVKFVHYLCDAICRSTASMPPGSSKPLLQLSMFLPIFIDMPAWRAVLLERVLGTPGGITKANAPKAWILLFESLVCVDVADRLQAKRKLTTQQKSRTEHGHPSLGGDEDSVKAEEQITTLESSVDTGERGTIGRRALKILQSRRSVIKLRAALEIAEQNGHDPCLEYLYEHLRMYTELGVSLRMSKNGPSLLRACRRHGDREPRLWMELIRLYAPLAAKEGYGSEGDAIGEDLELVSSSPPRRVSPIAGVEYVGEDGGMGKILGTISDGSSERGSAQDLVDEAMVALDRSGLLSQVEIVELVGSACPDAPWSVVREYFERCAAGLKREAAVSEHAGLQLDGEIRELRREAKRLGEETVVIKPTTCASCEDVVSVPAVHFFCEHSFHVSCLAPGAVGVGNGVGGASAAMLVGREGVGAGLSNEGKTGMWGEECPQCAPELDAMVSMRQALQDKNRKHEEFFAMLKNSRDGFATIVEFLGRSPFL